MPICPRCNGKSFIKHGKTPAGSQLIKCQHCHKVFVPEPKTSGRKLIGDRPLTPYERIKKYNEKKRKQEDKNND
jgi:transposase-like protein